MIALGVWVPYRAAGPLGPPEALPLGRAALALADEGVDVILGVPAGQGGFSGVRARPGRWEEATVDEVVAAFDRFPSASRPQAFAEGLRILAGRPVGNAPALTELCRDKLRSQRVIESAGIAMPAVVGEGLHPALSRWGAAYLKPRHGSFGEGVTRVEPGAALPEGGDVVLQQAITPPAGWAGISLRVLVQRTPAGALVARSPVARRHPEDPVVNAARGAEVVPAEDVDGLDLEQVSATAWACAAALFDAAGAPSLEAGVDLVVDADGRAWPIEVNGRPRGRLAVLARRWPERFAAEHLDAVVTPLRTLVRTPA